MEPCAASSASVTVALQLTRPIPVAAGGGGAAATPAASGAAAARPMQRTSVVPVLGESMRDGDECTVCVAAETDTYRRVVRGEVGADDVCLEIGRWALATYGNWFQRTRQEKG